MEMPNWEFDRNQHDFGYVLTGTDREYLQTKRKADHPDDPEERIAEKTNKLPARIQDLLIDIILLQADDRLTEEIWEELLNSAHGEYQINKLDKIYLTDEEKLNPTISVGHQLGVGLRSLYEPVEQDSDRINIKQFDFIDEISSWENLLWGFILAFIGRDFQHINEEKEAFEELMNEFHQRMEKRDHEVSKRSEVAARDGPIAERREIDKEISTYFEEYDLNPSLNAVKVLRKTIIKPLDQPPEKVRGVLEEILDQTPFREINTVEAATIRDMENIKQNKIQSLEADDVFEAILKETSSPVSYRSDNTVTKGDLSDHFPNEAQNNTTQALRSFGKRYEHQLWPQEKILEKTDEGWRLTNYGALVAHSLRNENQDTEWMYDPYLIADGGVGELRQYTIPVLEEFFDEEYDTYWAYLYGS